MATIRRALLLTFILLITSACSNGNYLSKGEIKYQLSDQDSITLSGNLLTSDIAIFIPVDLSGSDETSIAHINQYYLDNQIAITVLDYDTKGDYANFSIQYADPTTLYIQTQNTLDQYAKTYYDSFDDLIKWETFIDYKSKDPVDNATFSANQYALTLIVNGSTAGAFYQVPGEIIFVSDEMNYKRINSTTIFIESGNFGVIIYQ